MLKFLLYIGFIIFVIYWFLILPFKPSAERERQQQRKKSRSGNINVDFTPENDKKSGSKGYQGGEYVDYEEIK